MTRLAVGFLLPLLLAAAATAQGNAGQEVVCGTGWVTFALPAVSGGKREKHGGLPMVNAPEETVLTLRKRDVRNLVFFPDTRGAEVVFRLEVAHPERDKVVYSALVTEQVWRDVLACLN